MTIAHIFVAFSEKLNFNIKQATYNNEKIWECCRSFVTATSQPDQPKYVGYILMHSRLIAGSQFFMT